MNTVTFVVDSVLNTLWQSVIVVGAVWMALRFSQLRVNAATRYVIWWITLAALFVLPWIHHPSPVFEQVPLPAAPALQHSLPAQVAAPFAAPVPVVLVTVPN